jgi:hypothetical protein
MRQEIPSERLDVSPLGIVGIDEETLIVDENIGHHQPDKSKNKILRAKQSGPAVKLWPCAPPKERNL